MNKLYFGDNLDVLKSLYKENPNGFIDLMYNDPPFNSKRNYNVLFEHVELTDTKGRRKKRLLIHGAMCPIRNHLMKYQT